MTELGQGASPATAESEQSTTGQAKEKVQETAQQVQQQVQEKAQEVKGQAGSRLREQIDARSTQAGSQLHSTADAMRRTGEQLRSEGNEAPAKITDAVSQRAERLGNYLTDANADRILRDVEDFARRQPWLIAIGGTALGFLASRFVKASSSRRYESYGGDGYSSGVYGDLAAPPLTSQPGLPSSGAGEPAMAAYGEESYVAGPVPSAPMTGAADDVSATRGSGTTGSSSGQPEQ